MLAATPGPRRPTRSIRGSDDARWCDQLRSLHEISARRILPRLWLTFPRWALSRQARDCRQWPTLSTTVGTATSSYDTCPSLLGGHLTFPDNFAPPLWREAALSDLGILRQILELTLDLLWRSRLPAPKDCIPQPPPPRPTLTHTPLA